MLERIQASEWETVTDREEQHRALQAYHDG